MKKALFVFMTIIVFLVGFFFTFGAAVIDSQEGSSVVGVCSLSYLGVIVPNIFLKIAEFLCFKRDYKKIYAFDIIGVLASLTAIIRLNILILGENYWYFLKHDFFRLQFPWIIVFLSYGVLLIFKARNTRK